jgi:hypothetical protein
MLPGLTARDAADTWSPSARREEPKRNSWRSFVWELGGSGERWIGASDGKSVGEAGDGTPYTWITGEPMDFDNWTEGQPNNSESSCQEGVACSCESAACYEHCGFMWEMETTPGMWNDRLCEHIIPYVCEWDAL